MTRLYTARSGQVAMFAGAKAAPASHANRGMDFEGDLNAMHAEYARLQTALVGKQHVPTQIVKGGQWAKVIGKSTVDYVGVMHGGRLVAFDAKECRESRIELSRLQDHQLEYLLEVEALGGLSFVLVRFPCGTYAVPGKVWYWAAEARRARQKVALETFDWTATGKASINVGEMREEWRVDGVDWLRTVTGGGCWEWV